MRRYRFLDAIPGISNAGFKEDPEGDLVRYDEFKEFISGMRERFYSKLERKTGWGKEELKQEFEQAILEAVL